ncbi:MAG TPA: glycosyltransferase family 4 protein [Chthoniobacterales bacterium]
MILLAHPFGNANVRAVLNALQRAKLLAKFVTTVGWSNESLLGARLPRRGYDLPRAKIVTRAQRELVRLLAGQVGLNSLVAHERGWASIDAVWQDLDRTAARWLREHCAEITAAYAYEDSAAATFESARELNCRRIYDLPIAYWETSRRLLREEAERYPDWEPTLVGTRDSAEKLARKTRELELADLVICPSNFVLDSVPKGKTAVVVPFGSPETHAVSQQRATNTGLRVLFAGAMTQRKGLADLFAAMRLIESKTVELIVMGSPLMPLEWYRARADFTHEPPRPHADVLRLMQSCDVLVLPSIVEGRALVQQEAMACGLPVIATKNAGADDVIRDGETGFLVPIRAPEMLAEKISWCATHRADMSGMGIAAQERASELTWRGYGDKVVSAVRSLIAE